MTTPPPNVGKAVALALATEWLSADCRDRVELALGWLGRPGANPLAVARYLQETVDMLESEPLAYLQARLEQQHADLLALVEARQAA